MKLAILVALALRAVSANTFDRVAKREELCPLFPGCDCVGQRTNTHQENKVVCKKRKTSEAKCSKLHEVGNKKGRTFNTVSCNGFAAAQLASQLEASEAKLEAVEAQLEASEEAHNATKVELAAALASCQNCVPTMSPTKTPLTRAEKQTCFLEDKGCAECCAECIDVSDYWYLAGLEQHIGYHSDREWNRKYGYGLACACVDTFTYNNHHDNAHTYELVLRYGLGIAGTPNDDCMRIEGDFNEIDARDGDDVVVVIGNGNKIYGGDGDDHIYAEGTGLSWESVSYEWARNDLGDDIYIYGGKGDDVLTCMSDSAECYIDGEEGTDTCTGLNEDTYSNCEV